MFQNIISHFKCYPRLSKSLVIISYWSIISCIVQWWIKRFRQTDRWTIITRNKSKFDVVYFPPQKKKFYLIYHRVETEKRRPEVEKARTETRTSDASFGSLWTSFPWLTVKVCAFVFGSSRPASFQRWSNDAIAPTSGQFFRFVSFTSFFFKLNNVDKVEALLRPGIRQRRKAAIFTRQGKKGGKGLLNPDK